MRKSKVSEELHIKTWTDEYGSKYEVVACEDHGFPAYKILDVISVANDDFYEVGEVVPMVSDDLPLFGPLGSVR